MKFIILLILAQTAVSTSYVALYKRKKLKPAERFLSLVPKIRKSSGNPFYIVCSILDRIRAKGYNIGDYLSSGSFKDVFTLTSPEGLSCVAKVSHGGCTCSQRRRNGKGPPCVCPVPNHIREIERQQKSEVSQFVLQCKDFFTFKLFGLEPVSVEIQERGIPAQEVYRNGTVKERQELHQKMIRLRSQIRATGHDVSDFNYSNVAQFSGGRLFIIDLGCVVSYTPPKHGPPSFLMKPSSMSNSDMSMS